MSDLPQTSTGKIARLPPRLREEVNRRIHFGESGPQILDWLNALPEVKAVLDTHFAGEAISPQNLSNWRGGQYQRWEREEKQLQRTRARAEYSLQLAKASGGNLAEGALAQLTGEVLEMVEEIADLREAGQKINPDLIQAVNKSLVAARAKELETQALALKERQANQSERLLALKEDEFELKYVAKFIDHAANQRAHDIATGGGSKEVKMEQLRELLFGRKPEGSAGTPARNGEAAA